MLKLFHAPDTCALAVHIALEESGAAYEAVALDMVHQAQRSPAYLAINPKGRVPALVTPHGVLTETPALLAYIGQAYPAAQLVPTDPFAFAQVQAFNSYLCSTVHVAHAHKKRGSRWADDPAAHEAMRQKVPQSMADAFALIEQGLLVGPWAMGDTYTVADPYLFTLSRWLEGDGVDTAAFPRVLAHRERVAQRPGVARVLDALQAKRAG